MHRHLTKRRVNVTTFGALCFLGIGATVAAIGQSAAQGPPIATADGNTDEVIVIAQRTGIPVWRVTGPRTTIVLVGSIGGVSPQTRWDPAALDRALAQADRVMFPESMKFDVGLFSMIGLFGRWHAQASLPTGQTLQTMTTPEQWARLVALRDRGVLKPGFERTHPYHLAMSLSKSIKSRRKPAPGVNVYVCRFLARNKAKQVPVAQGNLKQLTTEFFASAPREHVACLMGVVGLVEAEEAGVRARENAQDARSRAWAARRVPDALAAKEDDGRRSCWPRGGPLEQMREASLSPAIRTLMGNPQVTLAVVSLDSLARPGGVLDNLVAAGFGVSGPRWKR